MERVPMTPAGLAKLKEKLAHIRKVERPKNVRDIETALDHGDLKENAEYHAAKEKQGQLDGQMRHISDQIGRAEVIDPTKLSGDKILFGATVQVYDVDEEKEYTYALVGPPEADSKLNRISINSPLARALLGKYVEDEVIVQIPRGERTLEVISVKFIAID